MKSLLKFRVVLVTLSGIALSFGQTGGGLALNKVCGDTNCGQYEYCNSDLMCDSCSKICNVSTHNYEQQNCERNCQDYIHDHISLYVNASSFAQLKETVETLQSLVVVSLCLSTVLIILIGSILLIAWLRYRSILKFNETSLKKKLASVSVISNKATQQQSQQEQNASNATNRTGNNGLSLRIPMPPAASSMTINETGVPPSAITTTTPLSTRHPSEDTTLEYAYDNPALTPSPGTNLRRTETTF